LTVTRRRCGGEATFGPLIEDTCGATIAQSQTISRLYRRAAAADGAASLTRRRRGGGGGGGGGSPRRGAARGPGDPPRRFDDGFAVLRGGSFEVHGRRHDAKTKDSLPSPRSGNRHA